MQQNHKIPISIIKMYKTMKKIKNKIKKIASIEEQKAFKPTDRFHSVQIIILLNEKLYHNTIRHRMDRSHNTQPVKVIVVCLSLFFFFLYFIQVILAKS